MAHATNSSMAASVTPEYFEEYGLHILQIRRGQKVAHAKLASELAKKSKEVLSAIVKDFLPLNKATKLIKKLHSKSALAEWIESAETLALGPHPESKLSSTKKEDLIKALGLETTAAKANSAKVEKDLPRKKIPAHRQTALPTEDKASAQSVVPSTPKIVSPQRRPAAIRTKIPPSSQSLPPREPHSAVDQIQQSLETAYGLAKTTANNKRKHDSAAKTTDPEQTPEKKTKLLQAISPPTDTPLPMSSTTVSQAIVVEQVTLAPAINSVQASQDREVSPDTTIPAQQVHGFAHHDTSLEDLDFCPNKDKDPSMVIHWSNEDIIVTHAPLETHIPEVNWQGSRTGRFETLDGGRTYTKQHDKVVYFTSIPRGYDGNACPSHSLEETPFLKQGRHGRYGDFVDDPDLQTGRGHQVDPSDLKGKREYEHRYYEFYKMWPHYPYIDRAKRPLASKYVEGKQELDEAEVWMMEYREKYHGEDVGHLWPCGCEKRRDGDESEEE